MTIEQRLQSMGLTLPEPATPVASYVPAVQTGTLVFCSGQLPRQKGSLQHPGRVGAEVSEEEAYQAARICVLNCLAAITTVVPTLDRIKRIVRLTGYVNSSEHFTNQPQVVNGASDLLVQLFGESGRHSRAAVGVHQLPLNACVEIDLLVEVED